MGSTSVTRHQPAGGPEATRAAGEPEPATHYSALDLLRQRNFRLLWLSGALWQFARWMDTVVAGWLALEMTNSPFYVALVGFTRLAPLLLFSLFTGAIADRVDRRRLLMIAQLGALLVGLGMATLRFTGHLQFWHIPVATLLLGLTFAADMPTRRSFLLDLVGRPRLLGAVALDNVSMTASQVLGAMAGGGLVGIVGAGGCYLLLGGAYLASFIFLLGIRGVAAKPLAHSAAMWRQVAEGLRYVRSSQPILGVLAATVAMNTFAFPYVQLLPVFARDVLHVGATGLGLLAASEGVGCMVGAIFVARRGRLHRRGLYFLVGSMAMALTLALFATSPWYPLSVALLVIAGLGRSCFSTMQSTIILTAASDAVRGRAMGALSVAIGSQPLGILAIGTAAALAGAPLATAAAATVAVLTVGGVLLRMPQLRRL